MQQPSNPTPTSSLFDSTSRKAGEVAARSIGRRHAQILQLLRDRGPMALFEIATALGVYDHQISGRFSELERDGLIEKTGQKKLKPDTNCEAFLYRLRQNIPAPNPPDLEEIAGYPPTLNIGGEGLFDRQPLCPQETWPGVPYRFKGSGLVYRVHLIPCPNCGAPLHAHEERGSDGKPRKRFRCPTCPHTWEGIFVTDPGHPPMLALLMRTL